MLRKRHIIGAALGTMTFLLAACAPKGIRPEAFVSQACMEADAAEARANENMQEYDVLASTLEEHEARLVELQRMKSRVVTGRMSDEELAQWQPERLPWEEPEPEPEPEPEVIESPAEIVESAPDTVSATEADATSYDPDARGADGGYGFEADQSDAADSDAVEGADETTPVDQVDDTSSDDASRDDAPADETADAVEDVDASVEEETSAPTE